MGAKINITPSVNYTSPDPHSNFDGTLAIRDDAKSCPGAPYRCRNGMRLCLINSLDPGTVTYCVAMLVDYGTSSLAKRRLVLTLPRFGLCPGGFPHLARKQRYAKL
eukprot:4816161-Amphidinium_carterae.1